MPPPTAGRWPLELDDLKELLTTLGARVEVDPRSGPPTRLVMHLALGLVGAAEQHAVAAEMAAREAGASIDEIGHATADVYAGAACQSDLDALALIGWRMTRTTQALQQLNLLDGPCGGPDPLGRTILLTAGALSALVGAAATMRNVHRGDGDTQAAALGVRRAITALDEAAKAARAQRVIADLLALVD
jgi:hypothetical protein